MSLTEQLQADMKTAMRDGDAHRRDTLRMAIAAVQNAAKDKRAVGRKAINMEPQLPLREAGEKNWECEIDGATWTQQTFPYQAKCLKWINEQYRALSDADRARVDALLAGTGCDAILVRG